MYLFVGQVAQGHLIELVGIHELVEDVGTEHDGLRDAGRDARHLHVLVTREHSVDEGQAASLAAQRTLADAGEIAVFVEAFALEDGHYALVFHLAVGDDGVEDNLAVGIDVLKRIPRDALQELRDGEECSRT